MWHIPESFSSDDATGLVESAIETWRDAKSCVVDVARLPADGCGRHPTVTLTFPGTDLQTMQRWLGLRLVFWPDGVCPLKPVALLSSHLGKRQDLHPWWYDLLRTAVIRVAGQSQCLCVEPSTTCGPAAARAARLFGTPQLALQVSAKKPVNAAGLAAWLTDAVRQCRVSEADENTVPQENATEPGQAQGGEAIGHWRAWVSPEITGIDVADVLAPGLRRVSAADRALVACGQQIFVLACRSQGKIAACLDACCDGLQNPWQMLFAAQSASIPDRFRVSIDSPRLIPWVLAGLSAESMAGGLAQSAGECGNEAEKADASRIAAAMPEVGPLTCPDRWLAHWTRPRFGKWPGQTFDEYLDELILGAAASNRSAFATLLRIISHQQLTAGGFGLSGFVSLTEVPLSEFRSRRVFRGHRNRFDFEPWGIAICREAIESLNGRPVIYGDESVRQSLPEDDHLFFQPTGRTDDQIDWSAEREWRVPASIDLAAIPKQHIVVFVDTPQDVASLQPHCEWPVVSLPQE